MLQSWFPFLGQLANTLYLIKRPHPAKAGDSTTCTSSLIDPELAVVLEGKKSAPQVPREWKHDSPTPTHELCLLTYVLAMQNSHHLHNTPHSPVVS